MKTAAFLRSGVRKLKSRNPEMTANKISSSSAIVW